MKKYAFIDLTGKYRYTLSRIWNENSGKVVFILLNPSTADTFEDDTTVKKCISFAKHWNFGSLEIVNLFAYRCTDAKSLKNVSDPVGIKNNQYILKAVKNADKIIAGWGNGSDFCNRASDVLCLLKSYKLYCLEINKTGSPKHPLFLSLDTELKEYKQKPTIA
ncbi:DUF1643 domain-containing protein [Clostridium sp. JNZ X4-2]